MAETIFDVVTEDPQVQHVAAKMEPAAVRNIDTNIVKMFARSGEYQKRAGMNATAKRARSMPGPSESSHTNMKMFAAMSR